MDQCKPKQMRSQEKNTSVSGIYTKVESKTWVKYQQILLERLTFLLLLYMHAHDSIQWLSPSSLLS